MKTYRKLLAIVPLMFITLISLAGCTMKSHTIAIEIVNAGNEENIFDKRYRISVIDETLNYIVYQTKNKNLPWLIEPQNKTKIMGLNKEVATNFYNDFNTRSVDTFVYKFAINNEFVDEKLEFNNANIKVISGITREETSETVTPKIINFDMYFQGNGRQYQFTGSINWKYIIKIVKKATTTTPDQFAFFWNFDAANADLDFTSLK